MAQCTATSKTSQLPCKQPAIPGGTVCRFHGGSAPQVKHAAAIRLAALVQPAIGRLAKSINSKSEGIAFRATQDVLDRLNMRGDALTRMLNPEANRAPQFSVTPEMMAKMEELPADDLRTFLRVLEFLTSPGGSEDAADRRAVPQLNP